MGVTRRDFLKRVAYATAGLLFLPVAERIYKIVSLAGKLAEKTGKSHPLLFVVSSLDVERLAPGYTPRGIYRREYSIEPTFSFVRMVSSLGGMPTLFVTARLAEHFPRDIRTLSEQAETGSHSSTHPDLTNPRTDLEREVRGSKERLEEITGKEVLGFRAPALRIDPRVVSAIHSAGYKYSSSYPGYTQNMNVYLAPFRHRPSGLLEFPVNAYFDFHGNWRFPRKIDVVRRRAEEIMEEKMLRDSIIVLSPLMHPWNFLPPEEVKRHFPRKTWDRIKNSFSPEYLRDYRISLKYLKRVGFNIVPFSHVLEHI